MPVHILGPRDKQNPHAINTTSSAKGWSRELSPFLVGPIKLYDGHVAQNVENGWQFSKLYKRHADNAGQAADAYWKWAKTGWANSIANRYPMGRISCPICSLWEANQLDYIAARRNIYIPLYTKAVLPTEAFAYLRQQYEQLGELWLWDYDGYDNTNKSWESVINDPTQKMGHAFILGMLLTGYLPS